MTALYCYKSDTSHDLIVARWQKLDRTDIAELFVCRHCMRIFAWQDIVEYDSDQKILESKPCIT